MITRSNFAKLLWPGINAVYGNAYKEYPVEYTELGYNMEDSKRAYEEDLGVTGFGLAQEKAEGGSILYDDARQSYIHRYVPVVYALGFTVTREMYEDNQYKEVGFGKAKALAFSMRQTHEIVGASVYNQAFDTSVNGGDGKPLVASDHPNFTGGTWSNTPSTDTDFSEASLEQAIIDVSKWTNDRGLRISVVPQKLVLPTDYQFEAARILKTVGQVYSADNTVNALTTNGAFPKGYCINHYLTDTNAWFFYNDVQNGLKHFTRRGIEFDIDNDFDTENAKYKATERYSVGWSDARAVWGSQGG